MFRTKHLLMDKATSTEGVSVSGYGTTQEDTTDVKTTEANGNSGATTESTAESKGTSNTETKTDDKSKSDETTTKEAGVSGYTDEVKTEETKTEETKNDTKVEDLKIDLRGLPEEQTKDIIDFAKDLKLSPEQAQSILDRRKSELDKFNEYQANTEKEIQQTYTKWEQELRTEWSQDFGANVKAVNNTLSKHYPETSKMLATSGKRLNPMQMKEFLSVSKLLSDEGTFEAGGTNSDKKVRDPSDYYTN
jgi:uncharacterized membrane-anchored protein YhcB (DUF1043 family)